MADVINCIQENVALFACILLIYFMGFLYYIIANDTIYLFQVTIFITVTDSNDNSPIFVIPPGGYRALVPENATVGTEVIQVMATDLDQGSNQQITYSIAGNATLPFVIDPSVSGFPVLYLILLTTNIIHILGWYNYGVWTTRQRNVFQIWIGSSSPRFIITGFSNGKINTGTMQEMVTYGTKSLRSRCGPIQILAGAQIFSPPSPELFL